MSFDKYYPNRKDWRKRYRKKCQRWDRSCRPGGSCPYCQGGRKFNDTKRRTGAQEQIDEYLKEDGS